MRRICYSNLAMSSPCRGIFSSVQSMKPSEQWEVGPTSRGSAPPMGFIDALRFLRSNFLFLLIGISVGILAGLYAQQVITPAYEARGKFIVDQLPFQQSGPVTDAEMDRDLVQTLIVSISSRDMRKTVESKLNLPQGSIAFLDLDVPLKLRRTSHPEANISIQSVKNSRIGTIEATSQNPEFAAKVVNAILDELVVYNQLGGRLRNIQMSLALNKLKADSLIRQVVDASSVRIKLAQENAALDGYLKQGLPLTSFPAFASDPTLNNLRTQFFLVKSEYDRAASTSTRGERLLGKRAEMEGLQGQLTTMAKSLSVSLRSQLEISKTQESNIQASLAATNETINSLSQDAARLTQSFGDPELMKAIASEQESTVSSTANIFVVVNKATPIVKPVRPKLWLNLFIGLALGGALGLGASLLHTGLDTRVRFAAQIERLTGCPCLVVLPKRPDPSTKNKKTSTSEKSGYAVGLAYMRSLIIHAASEGGGILGFSPTRKGSVTSSIVADLAILLASEGKKTLIVDLHPANPFMEKRLGVTIFKGLDEFLNSHAPLADFIALSSHQHLGVLGPKIGCAPIEGALGTRPLADELVALQSAWDFILLDGPCILSDWGLLLSLPGGAPLFLTAEYNQSHVTDIVRTLYHTQGPQWKVPGLFLLNSPHSKG